MATPRENDDILVTVWLLVILAKLHLVDCGGTLASIIDVAPVNDFRPFVLAKGNAKVHGGLKA